MMMDGRGGYLCESRGHLCGTPGGGEEHDTTSQRGESMYQRTDQRSFARAGITIEQEHIARGGSGGKLSSGVKQRALRREEFEIERIDRSRDDHISERKRHKATN